MEKFLEKLLERYGARDFSFFLGGFTAAAVGDGRADILPFANVFEAGAVGGVGATLVSIAIGVASDRWINTSRLRQSCQNLVALLSSNNFDRAALRLQKALDLHAEKLITNAGLVEIRDEAAQVLISMIEK